MAIAHVTDGFVAVLCIHKPGALCSRKRHTCSGLPWLAAGTLVSPCSRRKSPRPGTCWRSCGLPHLLSCWATFSLPDSFSPSSGWGSAHAQFWTGHSQSQHCPAGGTSRGNTRSAADSRAHRGTEEKQGTHKRSTNTAAESQNTRPQKTFSWGSVYTEPLVLSLHFSDYDNSVSVIKKLVFSATLKQTFLSSSGESLFFTFFNMAWARNNILMGCCLFKTKCGNHIQKQPSSINFLK